MNPICARLAGLIPALLLAPALNAWGASHELSEHDFLDELPVVLSASRLQQPLADAPGAMTIIDRELIKASGAREIVDLFRLVPGFQVGISYHSKPSVAYHGLADDNSRQMLVMVDGRSVYSPFFLGGITWNTLRLSLDDIERIEVMRGSNSAAYGANAFMGVINIITRHASQSQGASLSTTQGNQGIGDHVLRYGGKLGALQFRLSAGRRSDDGFSGFNDSRLTDYLAFRGDLQLNPQDELQLHLGTNRSRTGAGFYDNAADPVRTSREEGRHLQAVWKRVLGTDEELTLNFYHMHDVGLEKYTARDSIANPPPFAPTQLFANVDADRQIRRSHIELQHNFRLNPAARVVWGYEQRYESVASRFLFDTDKPRGIGLGRLFGNLEWRLAPMWLVNAGAMIEKHSFTGADLSPRLMLNFQPASGQTLRLGTTTAYRTPSLAEERGLIRYYVTAVPPSPFPSSQSVVTKYQSLGGLKPERVRSGELSYLGEFKNLGLTVDARAFREHVTRIIDEIGNPGNFINHWDAVIRGYEYQLRWAPSPETLILFNQSRLRIASEDGRIAESAPTRSTTLFLSQRLPLGWQLSLAQHWVAGYRWLGWSSPQPMQRRLDVRLGYPFRSGQVKGELALVSQNVRDPYSDFRADYLFERRSFVALSLEF